MIETIGRWAAGRGGPGVRRSRGAGAVLALGLAILSVAYAMGGTASLAAAAAAALLCLVSGGLSMLVSAAICRVASPPTGWLAGMLLRMALPLSVVMVVYGRGGWLVGAGMIYYVLVFYMIALAIETWIAVELVGRGTATASRGEQTHG